MNPPVRIAITGAAGQIGYQLCFRIAAGDMLGPDQPVILQLLEITPAMDALQGVVMELNDAAFPLLMDIVATDDAETAFQDADFALLVGAVLGYAVAYTMHGLDPDHPVGAALLNMAVFGAVLSYALQMSSFVLLRLKRPEIERPYRSPLGIPGAVVALVISLVTLAALFLIDAGYQYAVLGALVWYAAGLAWFALVGRHRLLRSPEERFALEAEERRNA